MRRGREAGKWMDLSLSLCPFFLWLCVRALPICVSPALFVSSRWSLSLSLLLSRSPTRSFFLSLSLSERLVPPFFVLLFLSSTRRRRRSTRQGATAAKDVGGGGVEQRRRRNSNSMRRPIKASHHGVLARPLPLLPVPLECGAASCSLFLFIKGEADRCYRRAHVRCWVVGAPATSFVAEAREAARFIFAIRTAAKGAISAFPLSTDCVTAVDTLAIT